MPLTRLLEYLAQAKEDVATGEHNIARQRSIIAELERDGQDATEARRLLADFEKTRARHVATLEGIRRELAVSMRGES